MSVRAIVVYSRDASGGVSRPLGEPVRLPLASLGEGVPFEFVGPSVTGSDTKIRGIVVGRGDNGGVVVDVRMDGQRELKLHHNEASSDFAARKARRYVEWSGMIYVSSLAEAT